MELSIEKHQTSSKILHFAMKIVNKQTHNNNCIAFKTDEMNDAIKSIAEINHKTKMISSDQHQLCEED